MAALATAPGRGGVAIVRVSGPQVKSITQAILGRELQPRHATHTKFFDAAGQMLDEGVAIYFPNPHSYTGEDILELQGHGGPVIVDLLLQRLLSLGARLARPGEFSERAFLNGKIDLTQAEAIADLIAASSKQAARSALRSLQGEFSREIYSLNEKIIYLRTYIEAAIDFTDEEIDFLEDGKITDHLNTIIQALKNIQLKAKQGSLLREGINAVIVGEPNVGKSSLLNCLSGKEIAIVTDIPGTTRDVLRNYILIDGMPVHIIDTAGLRESTDIVEQEGIRRAYKEMSEADIVLHLVDASANSNPTSLPTINCETIFVRNKIDRLNELPSLQQKNGQTIISLSAKTSAGIDLLKQHIKSKVGYQAEMEGIYLARRRHLDALARSQQYIDDSLQQLTVFKSSELAAEDLRQAHLALCEITGEFTTDDLLGRIFSSFCIGK